MTKQQKVGPFSVPVGVDRLHVLQGLTNLAHLLDCNGRGAAPSASAFIVQLGLLARQPGTDQKIAQALAAIFASSRAEEGG